MKTIPIRVAIPTITMILLMAGVMLLTMFGGTASQVQGQEGGSDTGRAFGTAGSLPPGLLTRQREITVTAPWGTVTVRDIPATATTSGVLLPPPPPPPGTRSSPAAAIRTPLTAQQIIHPDSSIEVGYTVDSAEFAAMRIERRSRQHAFGPPTGWAILSERHVHRSRYPDYTAPIYLQHEYRLTPILTDDSELASSPGGPFYADTNAMLLGMGVTTVEDVSTVYLLFQAYGLQPHEEQRVTIKRYDNLEQAPATAHTLPVQTFGSVGINSTVDEDVVGGKIYYYKAEYAYLPPGATDPVKIAINVPPVAVMAGYHDSSRPSVPVVSVADRESGKVDVTWTVPDDNRQARAFEVLRRPVKPISTSGWTSAGLVSGHSVSFYTPIDTVDTPYEYQVRPMGLTLGLQTAGPKTVHPAVQVPQCSMVKDPDWPGEIRQIHLEQDLTGPMDGFSPRSIDAWVYDSVGMRCGQISPDDYHLQRKLFYRRTTAATCDPAGVSCELPGETEWQTMYNSRGYLWGFPRLEVLAFDDEPLPKGEYVIYYRVCLTGIADDSYCSGQLDTGKILIGVDSASFPGTGTAELVAVNRVFPAGYTRPE